MDPEQTFEGSSQQNETSSYVEEPVASTSASATDAAPPKTAVETYSQMFPSLRSNSRAPAPVVVAKIAPTVQARTVTERFEIPSVQMKGSFGTKAYSETCKGIMKDTNTQMELSISKNGILSVIITGKQEQIAAAKKKLLASVAQQYELKITIPKEHHSSLIGKGGKKLKELQDKTGAKINVPKSDSNIDYVTISGDHRSVDQARIEINAFVNEKVNSTRETLVIEPSFYPFIFGRNNENLKQIMESTNTKIFVPPIDSEEKEITISGLKTDVTNAIKTIQEIYGEKKRNIKSVTVSVNKKLHQFVLGVKNAHVLEVYEATGCTVEVPPASDPSESITVRGDEANLLKGLQLVLDKSKSMNLEEIPVDNAKLQRYITLKARNKFKDLEKDTKCTVSFNTKSIDIQGPQEQVEKIKKSALNILAELNSLKFEELDIPHEYYKFIIGKAGKNIQKIQADFKAEVIVPHEDEDTQVVLLAGDKNSVKNVKEHLLKTVKDLVNLASSEVKVDQKYIKVVIGKKGETIKKLNEEHENVSITIDKNSEKVNIRGPKQEVESLVQQITKMVEEARHYEVMSNFSEEISVDKNLVKFLVGKGGSNINKLRESYDVHIEFEKREGDEEKESEKEAEKEKEKEKSSDKKGGAKDKKGGAGTAATKAQESNTRKITIQGFKKNVETVKEILLNQAKEFTEGGGLITLDLKIDQKYHGNLIGAQGKFVRSLIERYGINVKFPSSDAPSDIVVLRGMKKSVEKAKAELMELLEYEISMSYTETLKGKNSTLKQVMGIEGSRAKLNNIMESTNTYVDFEKDSDTLTIRGLEKNVKEAKRQLSEYLHDVENSVSEQIEVDPTHFRALIGLKGANVLNLSQKHNVNIKFPEDKTSKIVTIKGIKKNVDAAKEEIIKTVTELEQKKESQHRVTLNLPSIQNWVVREYSRKIQNENGVRVIRKENSDEIIIVGKPESSELVKKLLLDFKPVITEFDIDKQYHPALSGWKIRRLEEDLTVGIYVPPRNTTDTIKVEGLDQESIDKAVTELNKLTQEYAERQKVNESNVSEIIPIRADQVGKIIGKKGATIVRITNLTDAKIDVSKEKSQVSIVGTPAAVALAKTEILELIQEEEEPEYSEEIRISPKYYGRLAGPKYSRLRIFEKDNSVIVSLPRNSSSDVVKVSGSEVDVKSAIELLLEMVQEYALQDEERESDRPVRFVEPKGYARKDTPRPPPTNDDPFFAVPPPSTNVDSTNSWSKKLFG